MYTVKQLDIGFLSGISTLDLTSRTAARRREEIKECFTKVKQVFLLYLWDSLVSLELISLIPLVGTPETDPLAVKLLDNGLYLLDNRLCIVTIDPI